MNITRTEGALLAIVFISFVTIGALLLIPGGVLVPEDDDAAISVIAEGYVKLDTSAAVVASCPVWIYETSSPVLGVPAFDTATTDAAGKYTLTVMVSPGQVLYIQVRKAASATADPYISNLIPIVIPMAAESGDTVPVGTVYVRDVSAANPAIGAVDQASNSISDNTLNYVNTTDTSVVVTLSTITADTWFGAESSYTDWTTGLVFWGAVVVWKGTVGQTFVGFDAIVTDPTNIWYIWRLSSFKNLAADPQDGSAAVSLITSGSFVADATVLINCYDCVDYVQMMNGVFTSSALTVPTITTKVA